MERARKVLQDLGYENISYLTGDGSRGWPENAPFDGIRSPPGRRKSRRSLKSQLAEGEGW